MPPAGAEPLPWLAEDAVHEGDCRALLGRVRPGSVDLSVWSPPYHVGKAYEAGQATADWEALLTEAVAHHARVLRPGGFLAVNVADILCFPDPALPRVQAEAPGRRLGVSRDDVLAARAAHPGAGKHALARLLGVSEQTIDRRLQGNNCRGGKHATQTRVRLVGGLLEAAALAAGLYLYDRRVWVKDPAWANSRWHSLSYRAVDEFEYLYVFTRPGVVRVRRDRLAPGEWAAWGSRAVWHIPSVRANDDHEAKFPEELPARAIRLLTDPGDLVLDCFAGSGTSLRAARRLGRRYLGIEKEPRYVALARRALAALTPDP